MQTPVIRTLFTRAAVVLGVGSFAGFVGHTVFADVYVDYFVPPPRPGLFVTYAIPGRIDFVALCVYALALSLGAFPLLGRWTVVVAMALTAIGGGSVGYIFSGPREPVAGLVIPSLAGGVVSGMLLAVCILLHARRARPPERVRFTLRTLLLAVVALSVLLAGIAFRRRQHLEFLDAAGALPRSACCGAWPSAVWYTRHQ